ncbi:hypothetical protein RHGRI_019816 [Rhododendron griersonianum]|uniref:Uncharacterized protein n=1 Tax=Rhododendron griersonianum TaxID=479676 RepID=A0AAV6JE31_9ERIC|nr:hypothetical protein RHGRI_019816 [Rhododendron griersonianum]
MGYVLRVRFASFFAGAAVASAMGLYLLRDDYKAAHRSISQQVQCLILSPSSLYVYSFGLQCSRIMKKLSSSCRSLCMISYQSPWHDPSLARKPALLLPSFKCGELGPLWRAEEIPSVGYKFRAGWLPSLDSWMYEIPVSNARSSCNQFYLGCEQKEVYLTTQGPPTLMKQVYIALVLNQEEGIFNKTPQIAIFPIACVDQRQSLRISLSLMKGIYESLDGRVSVLEKLKEAEATKQVDAAE